jgi:hypothetical protein
MRNEKTDDFIVVGLRWLIGRDEKHALAVENIEIHKNRHELSHDEFPERASMIARRLRPVQLIRFRLLRKRPPSVSN